MKKLNEKGFFLVETVIVSTFVAGVLIFIYIQINNLNRNYQRTFQYDTVNSLYSLNDVKDFLDENVAGGLTSLKTYTDASLTYYLDFTNCPIEYLTNTDYCTSLFQGLSISRLIMVKENMSNFNLYLDDNPTIFDQNFKRYLNYIGTNANSNRYLLIAYFTNDTYAHLAIK